MFSEIILNTVVIPFVLGIVLFFAARKFPEFGLWGAFVTGIAVFCIYILLEGWPSLPPISSKPKVAVLIAGFTILNVASGFLRINRFALILGLLSLALLWIGWNRIGDIEMLPRFAALMVPVAIGGWAFQNFDQQDQSSLFWPITLIAFAIGGALIALLGAYIGLAQAMGAVGAFLGGFALLTFIFILFRPNTAPTNLPQNVHQVIFLSLMSLLIAIGLYAPEVSTIAIATMAMVLLLPGLTARFARFPTALQPVIYGITTAMPVGVAIAIAAL
ncbi:MAG: hypothetical protein COA78_37285 [Blastopirellula sp.]|nr:MAG: hypothetical protein COA78_37285 [Blastopirellula sp.]